MFYTDELMSKIPFMNVFDMAAPPSLKTAVSKAVETFRSNFPEITNEEAANVFEYFGRMMYLMSQMPAIDGVTATDLAAKLDSFCLGVTSAFIKAHADGLHNAEAAG